MQITQHSQCQKQKYANTGVCEGSFKHLVVKEWKKKQKVWKVFHAKMKGSVSPHDLEFTLPKADKTAF